MMKLEALKFTDYQRLKPYFERQPHRLCAYSLPSILVWQNEILRPYALEQDNVLIIAVIFEEPREERHLILPLSPEKQFPPALLHAIARDLGHTEYRFVTDAWLDTYPRDEIERLFTIEEEPEYDDYIYRQSDLADLPGNQYSKKRNLINQFVREYIEADRVAIHPIKPEVADECVSFLEEWCKERDCGNDPARDLACEKIAAINALQNIQTVGMEGLLIRVDGKVCAFGIASHLTDDMGVLHFEKAFAHVKGLYQYLDQECARRLFNGYQYINKESDMGIPGLSKAKASYYPVMKLKSYRMLLKQ